MSNTTGELTAVDIYDRIERAQSQSMTAHVVQDDPLTVEVENEDSVDGESIHTVLPESLYCSCWDSRARVPVCKHLAFLALNGDDVPDHVGETTQRAITHRLKEIQSELLDLRTEIDGMETEQKMLRSVRETVAQNDDSLGDSPGSDVEEQAEDEDGNESLGWVSDLMSK